MPMLSCCAYKLSEINFSNLLVKKALKLTLFCAIFRNYLSGRLYVMQ
jgi:hypothetical protein